jgi:hypothetical protein
MKKKFQKAAFAAFARTTDEKRVARKRWRNLTAAERLVYDRLKRRAYLARVYKDVKRNRVRLLKGRDRQRRFRADLARLGIAKEFYNHQNELHRRRKREKAKAAAVCP